jgi:hypothetical protein
MGRYSLVYEAKGLRFKAPEVKIKKPQFPDLQNNKKTDMHLTLINYKIEE